MRKMFFSFLSVEVEFKGKKTGKGFGFNQTDFWMLSEKRIWFKISELRAFLKTILPG
jgi:hypothetical protein